MLLTFVALMATNTTTEEKLMVRSETIFEQVFGLSESANIEGIQLLADSSTECSLEATLDSSCATDGILAQADEKDEDNDVKNLDTNLDNVIDGSDFNVANRSGIDGTNDTYKKILQKKIEGGSLGLETSRLYSYNAYGYSEKYSARSLIKMGYKKRF